MESTIVLARLDAGSELADPGRSDIGIPPKFKPVQVPTALVWLRFGSPEDIEKARTFAAREGYTVIVYPTSEPEPLIRARREITEVA